MAKSSAPKQIPSKAGGLDAKVPTKFVDRDLASINPLDQQFEPTEQSPVPQGYKMAGGCD